VVVVVVDDASTAGLPRGWGRRRVLVYGWRERGLGEETRERESGDAAAGQDARTRQTDRQSQCVADAASLAAAG